MAENFEAPRVGASAMPVWTTGELIEPPRFTSRNWFALLGPGLIMGGAAIGGGEWLVGPIVTAKYGGGLLWLATISILGQVIYNIEISRYTLYTGEPIFTGKFRTLPGPRFWVFAYLLFDFGSVFPYLAANAATPLATILKGGVVPTPNEDAGDFWLMKGLGYVIFLGALVPLLFGGKIYRSLKAIMSVKIVVVFSFLLVVSFGYTTWSHWGEIWSGFFKFGTVPVVVPADGAEQVGAAAEQPLVSGGNLDNIFVALWEGRELPEIDFSLIAFIAALAAIAGSGGLSNTPVSNYTRDQGWGMGHYVGAIPSVVGGHDIQLSHTGCVFEPNAQSLPRWKRWYRHVLRDQLVVWMPACFIGLALPSMLSVGFLPRGYEVKEQWTAAAMTADGVYDTVADRSGELIGSGFWFMTLFCGFLVLAPSMASSADGIIRRWVDVFWTSSRRLQELDPSKIKKVYFYTLTGYAIFGMIALMLPGQELLKYATMIFNIALGVSCWHTLAINVTLLPKPLRPNWFIRIALLFAGGFFFLLGVITVMDRLGLLN